MKEIDINVHNCPTIPWEELRHYELNDLKANKGRDVNKLKNAIINRGFNFPFYIWENHRYIIDGTGRTHALASLELDGWRIPPLPVVQISAPDLETCKVLVLQASSEHGEITQESFDKFITGLDLDFLDEINIPDIVIKDLDDVEPEQPEEDPNGGGGPPSDKEPLTQHGDVYTIGPHRLICGDANNITTIELLMQGRLADLVFTDPPYNVAKDAQRGHGKKANTSAERLKEEDWDEDFDPTAFLSLIPLVISECASVYVCTSHYLFGTIQEYLSSFMDYTSFCVWHKPNPMPNIFKRQYTSSAELINFAARGEWVFNFPKEGHAPNVWTINKISKCEFHPTQKPVEVPLKAIEYSTYPKQIVLDLFGGSGTTMVACHQSGRICRMLEISPKYCDAIVFRMKKLFPKIEITRNGESIDEFVF